MIQSTPLTSLNEERPAGQPPDPGRKEQLARGCVPLTRPLLSTGLTVFRAGLMLVALYFIIALAMYDIFSLRGARADPVLQVGLVSACEYLVGPPNLEAWESK